jgi:hypothetical protein
MQIAGGFSGDEQDLTHVQQPARVP